jgi:hypothetical protein
VAQAAAGKLWRGDDGPHVSRPPKVAQGTPASLGSVPARPAFMGCGVSQPVNGIVTWKYKNGDEYVGEHKGRKRHGRGKYVGSNGETYEGEYSEDKPHGWGKMVYAEGGTYEGEWRKDKMHGRGKYVWPDGDTYEGEYSKDEQHGRGVFTYAVDGSTSLPGCDYSWNAGDRYDGGFVAGVRHGACMYTFFNGETLDCTWADGRCPEFTARQRAVQAAPDHARAEGYASVQDKAAAEAAQH